MHNYGYTIEKTTYEHTASGIGEYVNSEKQMTSTAIDKFFIEISEKLSKSSDTIKYTPLNMYLLELKDGETHNYSSKCRIYFTYQVDTNSTWFGKSTKYYYADINNLIIDPDSSVNYEFNSGYYRGSYNSEAEAIENFESNGYSVKKIKW